MRQQCQVNKHGTCTKTYQSSMTSASSSLRSAWWITIRRTWRNLKKAFKGRMPSSMIAFSILITRYNHGGKQKFLIIPLPRICLVMTSRMVLILFSVQWSSGTYIQSTSSLILWFSDNASTKKSGTTNSSTGARWNGSKKRKEEVRNARKTTCFITRLFIVIRDIV